MEKKIIEIKKNTIKMLIFLITEEGKIPKLQKINYKTKIEKNT